TPLLLARDLHLRAPPSFPTRRSSDLWRGAVTRKTSPTWPSTPACTSVPCWKRTAGNCPKAHAKSKSPSSRPCAPTTPKPCARLRSEEHTSELQSRENLVCRLLLEKKN